MARYASVRADANRIVPRATNTPSTPGTGDPPEKRSASAIPGGTEPGDGGIGSFGNDRALRVAEEGRFGVNREREVVWMAL